MTTDSAHLIFYNACLDYCKVNLTKVCNMQNNNFMLLTGPEECLHNWSGQLDPQDYAIKCMDGR